MAGHSQRGTTHILHQFFEQGQLAQGFEYDYFLKLEDEMYWLLPLLNVLGIREPARIGWGDNETDCFYRPAGMSCSEFFDNTYVKRLELKMHALNLFQSEVRSTLEAHYTPELASMVNKMFLQDFITFQYPLWDGESPYLGISSMNDLS